MKTEIKINLWERWLKRYWDSRIQGTPILLDDGELIKMVEWAVDLECVFPEVVGIICNGPIPQILQHTSLFFRLDRERTELIKKFPNESARLLVHLTKNVSMPKYFCSELEKLTEKIIAAEVQQDILDSLCNNLAAIGCDKAAELSACAKRNALTI
jgi:hypothetical protein